ncbi:hypothetical protein MPSEU_000351300 [Mayamaea pseudoterrestris]|nr:hypothetical protein MPSEU_000351300 [Mayamaea pseudoterrestris]
MSHRDLIRAKTKISMIIQDAKTYAPTVFNFLDSTRGLRDLVGHGDASEHFMANGAQYTIVAPTDTMTLPNDKFIINQDSKREAGNNDSEQPETSFTFRQKDSGAAAADDDNFNDDMKNQPATIDHSEPLQSSYGSSSRRRMLQNHFMPLFTHPQQRQRWGDSQLHPHKNWGDVFFDLFYVAAAYNLGHLLKADPAPRGLLYLIGCFLPIMGLWATKMLYDCRFFVGNDLWHRLLEICKLVCLATAVWSIRDVAIMSHPSDYPDMFHYCAGVTGALVVVQIRFWEIIVCQLLNKKGLFPEAFYVARRDLIWTGVQLAFYFAATVYAGSMYFGNGADSSDYEGAASHATNSNATLDASTDDHHRSLASEILSTSASAIDDTPIILCIVGTMLGQVLFSFIVGVFLSPQIRKIPIESITVPMHVEYAIHRYGEWTMLMLGESILSLLIVNVVDSEDYYGVFFAGVIAIIFLQYVHFRSQPSDPAEHAMRRSRLSGMLVNYTYQIYSASLIILGCTYKMFLYEVVEATQTSHGRFRVLGKVFDRWLAEEESSLPTEVRQQNIANLFSGSMACVWLCQDIMLLAHKGLHANYHRGVECSIAKRAISVSFVLVRVGLIVFFATLSQYETDPARLAAIGCAGVVMQFLSRAVGTMVFTGKVNKQDRPEVFHLKANDGLCSALE